MYDDDVGILSRSPEGIAPMMTVVIEVCEAFGLTVSEIKTEAMCLRIRGMQAVNFEIKAAGQSYKHTNRLFCLTPPPIQECSHLTSEAECSSRVARYDFHRCIEQFCDKLCTSFEVKFWMLEAKVAEKLLLYKCMT